jgi:RND family efflux transporter MFP subunit
MNRFLFPALLLFAAGCAKKSADDAASDKVQAVVGASVATVKTERFAETVEAIGTVVARAGHVATVSAPANARVYSPSVQVGDRVQTGQSLVALDRSPFQTARIAARAALQAAQSTADRTQRLAVAGVIPRKEAEQAAADLEQAKMNDSVSVRMLVQSTMFAPMAGIVTRMNANVGQMVEAGQVLAEVTDPSVLDVAFAVSATDAQRVHVGQSVVAHADEGRVTDTLVTGTVASVSPIVDSTTHSVLVRAELKTGVAAVRIGQTLTGHIVVADRQNAVVVSPESLVPDGEGFKVFVVDAQGMALSRPVTIGGRSDDRVWIREGLKAGEHVVTQGAYGVSDSAKVGAGTAEKKGEGAKEGSGVAKKGGGAP